MIDLKVTTIGGPEIAGKLAKADSGIRDEIRDELAEVGQEIVDRAQSNAPKRTGIMASKVIWFFGTRAPRKKKGVSIGTQIRDVKWKDGRVRMEAMPTGRVAHLMERGVNASFHQRPGRRGADKQRRGQRAIGPYAGEAMHGPDWRYPRTLKITPQPFFMPAVESVGGAAGVNARLQGRLDRLAGALQGAA